MDRYPLGRVRKNNDNRFCGSNLVQAVPALVLSENPPPQHDKLGKHHWRRLIEFDLPLDWFEILPMRQLLLNVVRDQLHIVNNVGHHRVIEYYRAYRYALDAPPEVLNLGDSILK
jgi:hypothetical protein